MYILRGCFHFCLLSPKNWHLNLSFVSSSRHSFRHSFHFRQLWILGRIYETTERIRTSLHSKELQLNDVEVMFHPLLHYLNYVGTAMKYFFLIWNKNNILFNSTYIFQNKYNFPQMQVLITNPLVMMFIIMLDVVCKLSVSSEIGEREV